MAITNLIVFEDPSSGLLELLSNLLKANSGPLKDSLVEEAAQVLRNEASKDASLRGREQWDFVTINELIGQISRDSGPCPFAFQCALTCLGQILSFLCFPQSGRLFLEPAAEGSSTEVIGHRIGVISAAVVKSSQDFQDIMDQAREAIAISFRIGAAAERKSSYVLGERSTSVSQWASMHYDGVASEASDMLTNCAAKLGPRSGSCYVSAIRENSTTISGPVRSLQALNLNNNSLCHNIKNMEPPLHSPVLFTEQDLVDLDVSSSFEMSVRSILCRISDQAQFASDLSGAVAEDDDVRILVFAQGELTDAVCDRLAINSHRRVDMIDLAATSSKQTDCRSKPTIAVVGMSGRFPEADDAGKLWKLLQSGRDVCRTIPPDRFNHQTHSDPTGKQRNTSKTPYGCFINQPGLFDSRFFNMSPKEAAQTDPAQRLAILTAYEALEMSGFVPNRTPSSRSDRVGTFYGQASDDWREINSSQDINTYFIPGGIRAFGPGRINYHLKFSGPSCSLDTACSSSFAAIHAACNSLWAGDCDTAIAGAANILTNPDIFAGLSQGHFLSPTGSCKTFDADADGYCRADGVGSVILKRAEDAESDGDNILGVILGIGTNHSADAVSITHPHAPTQAKLYQSLLDNNGVDSHDVDYVEMHGTGTQAGDFHEMRSVSDVFAPRHGEPRQHPVYVGSAKANVGHAEAAAGIISLIKVLQMLRNDAIPPHVGIKGTINPTLPADIEARNIKIPAAVVSWPRRSTSTPRTAFLNNFSAAGGNTSLILREHIAAPATSGDPRVTQIVTVTAKTIRSMHLNIKNISQYIDKHPDLRLADLSYTLTARRMAHSFRKSFAATTLENAQKQLLAWQGDSFEPFPVSLPGVIFTFTGQGALYLGIAKSLFTTCATFRKDVLECDYTAQSHGFPSFLEIITGSNSDLSLVPVVVSQVGQVAIQLALANLWQSWGIHPTAVIGHSLGEYPALVIAGVMSASDMIYLVGRRATLMETNCSAGSHGMLIVNGDAEDLEALVSATSVQVSCENGPKMTVLGGPNQPLLDCAAQLEARGLTCTKLSVLHAYHTTQVDPILDDLRAAASQIQWNKPRLPVLSSVLGRVVDPGSDGIDPDYVCQHARRAVKFRQVLSGLKNNPEWTIDALWLEIGPHPTCIKMVKRNLGPTTAVAKSLDNGLDPWQTMSEAVCQFHDRGFSIEWQEFHRGFEGCHRLLELPTYAWDLKNYWIEYENDWALTKGCKPELCDELSKATNSSLSTTSIHRVLQENIADGRASIICETDFSEPILRKKAAGHKVNGTALCSSSLYGDMALTVADHLHKLIQPDEPMFAMDLCDLDVNKPFIIDGCENVRFLVSASASTSEAHVELYTVSRANASEKTIHVTCVVKFAPVGKWTAKLQKNSYLIQSRIAALERAAAEGQAHRIQRKLIYKLFSNFVDYDDDYQGIEELILDSPELEARANVILRPLAAGQNFHTPPTWIDSLLHLTGAILNASDAIDTAAFVYISEGLKSLRILEHLKEQTVYTTYTRMQNVERNVMEGDLWIFEGERVVGIAKGIKFQRIPRSTIDMLLPRPSIQTKPTLKVPPLRASNNAGTQLKVNTDLSNPVHQTIVPKSSAPKATEHSSLLDEVLQIMASECEVDISELVDGSTLTALGIDSLLSLEILAKIREDLSLDLRPRLFMESQTIGELKTNITVTFPCSRSEDMSPDTCIEPAPGLVGSECSSPQQSVSDSIEYGSSPGKNFQLEPRFSLSSSCDSVDMTLPPEIKKPSTKAVSYLLSGNPKTASKFLFIFPDGSGSATSYAELPPLGGDVATFGLNCPYMTSPQEWTSGIEAVTDLYIREIRRRAPTGPYNLAGWSAGGILAYNAAWQLQRQGERAERLILIDSPCPVALPPMPVKMFRFLDTIGLLGDGTSTPEWVIPHFAATVRNLDKFVPPPFTAGTEPRTTNIWARHGVLRESKGRRPPPEPSDPPVMNWLLEDRTDFGCNGWDTLIAPACITNEDMDGHHFSMTKEHADELGILIGRAMV